MKNSLLLLLITTLHFSCHSQEKISLSGWQSDLRFLQQTVHKDYPFLLKNVSSKDFDAEVDKLYRAIPSMQEHQVMAGFARIVALFKYGHTDIGWRESPVKYHIAPVSFYWFSDGVFVEGADKQHASIIGARLVKVEGMPVLEALKSIKPLVPAENEQYFKTHGPDLLCVPEALHAQGITSSLKNAISYTFEKDGKTTELSIPSVDAFRFPRQYGFVKPNDSWQSIRIQDNPPYYLKQLDKIYYYEYLPAQKTVYVRHSQIQDDNPDAIPAFYKKVFDFIEANDVEKLILDVRLNGGGNNYKNKPIVTGIIECKKINKPGKLFVIIGRRTFSACQNLVNELSNYTNAVFVGEPTSENINFYGDNRRVVLPNSKLPVYLSFAWWQDKPQWENGPWLAPQYAVDMSFEDYRLNRDPVLDACLNFSDKDLATDPMQYLRELFAAGKMDELEASAKKMVADPRYRYVAFEERINRAGYDMLNRGQNTQAISVFELNTRLYPQSANCWDSLGEAYWKNKQADKAIECYNKAITLDPSGETGANARSMISKIKGGQAN